MGYLKMKMAMMKGLAFVVGATLRARRVVNLWKSEYQKTLMLKELYLP
jgi:hypothetical protein